MLALALIGESVGHNWESWRHHLAVLDYAVAATIVAGMVYLALKRRRAGSTRDGATGEPT